jgi:hypothetical protein
MRVKLLIRFAKKKKSCSNAPAPAVYYYRTSRSFDSHEWINVPSTNAMPYVTIWIQKYYNAILFANVYSYCDKQCWGYIFILLYTTLYTTTTDIDKILSRFRLARISRFFSPFIAFHCVAQNRSENISQRNWISHTVDCFSS